MTKRRQSMTQRVVSVATTGLPGPLKSVLTSRIGAPLTVLAVGGLLASGVIHFQLLDGRPSVSIDRQRAAEVKQEVKEYVERVDLPLPDSARDRVANQAPYGSGAFPYSEVQPQVPTSAPPGSGYNNPSGYPPTSYATGPSGYPPTYGSQPTYPAAAPPVPPRYPGGSRRLAPFFADRPTEQR